MKALCDFFVLRIFKNIFFLLSPLFPYFLFFLWTCNFVALITGPYCFVLYSTLILNMFNGCIFNLTLFTVIFTFILSVNEKSFILSFLFFVDTILA